MIPLLLFFAGIGLFIAHHQYWGTLCFLIAVLELIG